MDFGSLPYVKNKEIKEDEIYLDDSTTPEEDDDFELSWLEKRLKKYLGGKNEKAEA